MTELVEVALVANEYEGAVLQALLETQGIPSLQQRVGFDGGQLGYAPLTGGGSRRIMVHAPRAEEARAILDRAEAEDIPEPVNARHLADAAGGRARSYGWFGAWVRVLLVSVVAMALAFAIFTLVNAFS